MKKHELLILIGAMLLISSCASVNFYSDNELKHKTGLKVYSARPYVLCDYSSGKEKVSVIWLPNLASPGYLVLNQGFGSNDLKIAIEDGYLKSLGVTTDSGIPETLNALASVVSKSASAAEMLSASPANSVTQTGLIPFELYELSVQNDSVILRKVNIINENPF
jgi:hypothetical protein